MRFFFITLQLLIISNGFSQIQSNYQSDFQPLPRYDDKKIKELTDEVYDRYHNLTRSHLRNYKAELSHVVYDITERLKEDTFINDDSSIAEIRKVFDLLVLKNDLPIGDELILIESSPLPNAEINPLGIIVLTTGLLSVLTQKEELAWVLGHVISHYLEAHFYEIINLYDENNWYSETYKLVWQVAHGRGNLEQLNKAQRKAYEYFNQFRLNEYESDSLGGLYCSNAGFNMRAAIGAFEYLGPNGLENKTYGQNLLYQIYSNKYPFRHNWVDPSIPLFHREPDQTLIFKWDSIQTHPENEHRYEKALKLYGEPIKSNPSRNLVYQFENVQSAYSTDEFDLCFYLALQLRMEFPKNAYLNTMIAKTLYGVYLARFENDEENNLYKVLNRYTVDYGNDLKMINSFLWNLTKGELLESAYYFLNNPDTFSPENEEHYYYLAQFSKLLGKEIVYNQVKNLYQKNFPKGEFKHSL